MSSSLAFLAGLEVYLPESVETTDDLAKLFPEWDSVKIASKTGISSRRISGPDEYSSDMAIKAGAKLFERGIVDKNSIDLLIVVSQTPDFILPGISFQVHEGLGLRRSSGAIDVNLGCSGYVYALGLAKGMIESNQCENVLVITSDTYSKLLNPMDKSVRSIFGDGATASLLSSGSGGHISSLVQGSDGGGAGRLFVPRGGLRSGLDLNPKADPGTRGLEGSKFDLYMDGPGIFQFTLEVLGELMEETLSKADLSVEAIDFFVFHQANEFMLRHIIAKIGLPTDKCPILMGHWGNTVSGTIPMALYELARRGDLDSKKTLLLAGFGVGLSWAGLTLGIEPGLNLAGQ